MKIYNEIGFGNKWVVSYEIEFDNGEEVRCRGWCRGRIRRLYLRYWIGKKVMVISEKGIEIKDKGKFMFKVIVGFEMM